MNGRRPPGEWWLSPAERTRVVKDRDSWWTVLVVDPVAVRLLGPVARLPRVTPVGLTAAGGACGLAAAALFLTGRLALGGVAFFLRYLLDQMDGKLARLRGSASQLGGFLDGLTDVVVTPLAFICLAIRIGDGVGHFGLLVFVLLPSVALLEAWIRLWWNAVSFGSGRQHAPVPAVLAGVRTERLRAWFHRHRLVSTPETVEAEVITLVLAPLITSVHLVRLAFGLSLALYLYLIAVKVFWTTTTLRDRPAVQTWHGTTIAGDGERGQADSASGHSDPGSARAG